MKAIGQNRADQAPSIALVSDNGQLHAALRESCGTMEIALLPAGASTARGVQVLIIDWLLSEEAGIEICRRLRSAPSFDHVPIVLIVGSNAEADKRAAIAAGANWLVVAPYSIEQLLERALLAVDEGIKEDERLRTLRVGDIDIDRSVQVARRRGRVVPIGPTDFRLLELLMLSPNRLVTSEQIIDHLWGFGSELHHRTVAVHVARLRSGLMTIRRVDPIRTVRGAGYKLVGKQRH